jgi:hypothetical protein
MQKSAVEDVVLDSLAVAAAAAGLVDAADAVPAIAPARSGRR